MFRFAHTRSKLWSLFTAIITTLGTRAIDIPSRYGFHLLIATNLGVIDAGGFYIVFGLLTIAAGLGRLGVDRAMTREIARALARNDYEAARYTIWQGLKCVLAFSSCAAACMAVSAPFLARELFNDPKLEASITLAAIALVPLCLSAAIAGALAGLHRVNRSQMIYSWAWPATFCAITFWQDLTLIGAFQMMVASIAVTAFIAAGLLTEAWPHGGSRISPSKRDDLGFVRIGLSLFSIELVQLMIAALPLLVLGVVASQQEVGIYAMAWRLVLVINLLTVVIAAVASPRFAVAAMSANTGDLKLLSTHVLGVSLALSALPVLFLAIGSTYFLSLLGAGFAAGVATFQILLASQVILLLSACTPEMLGMSGNEKPIQFLNRIAMIMYIPVLIILSMNFGDEGAAAATVSMTLMISIGSSLLAKKHLGFIPLLQLLHLEGRRS